MKTIYLAAALLCIAPTAAWAQRPGAPAGPRPDAGPGMRGAARNMQRVNGEIARIAGTTYTVKALRGNTVQVTIPAGTPVTRAGQAQTAALSDLKVGTHIAATGQRTNPTAFTARRVVIVEPSAAGTIETVTAKQITLRLADGKKAAYTVDAKTRWMRNRQPSPWTNFKAGERVVVTYKGKTATSVRLANAPQRGPGQRGPGQRGPRGLGRGPNAPARPAR